jgi:hemerythrin-like domain-containing protein
MGNPFDDLKHEHEAIRFSLRILGVMANRARAGTLSGDDALALIDFLKEFADKCHRGKEEGILFPELEKAGIPNAGGPIGAMLHEHEVGRGYIRDMEAALRKKPADPPAFARAADAYGSLLDQHIEKENTILFPMGERVTDERSRDGIYERFEAHEEKVIGAGRHEELHAILNEFEKKYL